MTDTAHTVEIGIPVGVDVRIERGDVHPDLEIVDVYRMSSEALNGDLVFTPNLAAVASGIEIVARIAELVGLKLAVNVEVDTGERIGRSPRPIMRMAVGTGSVSGRVRIFCGGGRWCSVALSTVAGITNHVVLVVPDRSLVGAARKGRTMAVDVGTLES